MNPIARNILAAFVGYFVGSVVNIALVNIGPFVAPLPEGADVSTLEGVRESMALFTPANFIFPFLGHALGTLAGAFVAARLAASHQMKFVRRLKRKKFRAPPACNPSRSHGGLKSPLGAGPAFCLAGRAP